MGDISFTGIVTGAALSTFGAWLGWWGAARNQERQHLRTQQAVARALREDLNRIREELGIASRSALETEGFYFSGIQVPAVHPWMQSAVIQIADAAAPAIGQLMRAERDLQNMRVIGQQIDEYRSRLKIEQMTVQDLDSQAVGLDALGDQLVAEVQGKHRVKQTEHGIEKLQFLYNLSLKAAMKALDAADEQLATLLNRPPPDWLPDDDPPGV